MPLYSSTVHQYGPTEHRYFIAEIPVHSGQMPRRRKDDSNTEGSDAQLGRKLKTLRTHAGISLRTLATRAGFSASFLSQLEKGQVSPSIASLGRIAAELGVTLAELFHTADGAAQTVVRGASRPAFTSEWSRARIESLTSTASGSGLDR